MVRRLSAVSLMAVMLAGQHTYSEAQSATRTPVAPDNVTWVATVLRRMATVQPGMTRAALLTVFTTEHLSLNGTTPSTVRLRRTFVSRDCPYFKVDVEFEAIGRPDMDASHCVPVEGGGGLPCDETVTIFVVSSQDRIVKISRPYVQEPAPALMED